MLLTRRLALPRRWLAVAVLALPTAVMANWQDMPEHLRLGAVGDSLAINGTPVQIRTFTSEVPMEKLLEEVRISWERNPERTSVVRTRIGEWIVLNQKLGKEHRSFQVRPSADGLDGRVALTSPQLARTPRVAVQLPASMTAVSIIDSVDNGRKSQQVIAVSTRSAEATTAALESTLKAQGWHRHVLQRGRGALVFSANRNGQELDANISAQKNGALVMMNTIIGNK
jgi:hypothetical protein